MKSTIPVPQYNPQTTSARRVDTAHGRLGKVLLIGGASGTGKTTLAKALALRFGVAWVQVDDLRLALQRSNVRMPTDHGTESLYFFERTPDVWNLPAERLRDGLIAVGETMTEAIAVVIENHIAQDDPAVIEGDGIHPALVAHPNLRGYAATGLLRAAFLSPQSEDELLRNMIGRGRGVAERRTPELTRIAEMNWLYSAWLEDDARRRGVHVMPITPRDTLVDRAAEVWDL